MALLAAVALPGWHSAATAHHRTEGGASAGVSVPSLTHGQMAVIASHRSAILALADAEPRPDATLRRLRNFAALEHGICLWGLMPGSVADEASPFNECAHAEFAALRALLLHLAALPRAVPDARELQDGIAREMRERGEALTLCRFSDESFNTADVVGPDWSALPFHGPTVFTLLAGCAFAASGMAAAWAASGRVAAAGPAPTR